MTDTGLTEHIDWPTVITVAAVIVRSYKIAVTLRQLFYRLVSEQLLPNTRSYYGQLSHRTAKLRREGNFPALYDRGRSIIKPRSYINPALAMENLARNYRLDRTRGQQYQVWLGVEKNALAGLLQEWFYDYGVPVLPLGGYSSEGLDRDVKQKTSSDDRPAILIYAGDFDASGMDIGRSFVETTRECWETTIRIGLNTRQIRELSLPVLAGKPKDPRAPKFIERYPKIHARHNFGSHGGKRIPVQVELDAIDPAELHRLFLAELGKFWDESSYQETLKQEKIDRAKLKEWRP